MKTPAKRCFERLKYTEKYEIESNRSIAEMVKRADTADVSVLFFSGCASILTVYGVQNRYRYYATSTVLKAMCC